MAACNNYGCKHSNCKPLQILNKCGPETQALDAISDLPGADGARHTRLTPRPVQCPSAAAASESVALGVLQARSCR